MRPTLTADLGTTDPPSFVRLTAHPLRWQLLRELVQSDRTVRELMKLVDQPQSLVSYHLRLLREGGLVSARNSSADRRDSYYAIDLIACRESLQHAGEALHPSVRIAPLVAPEWPPAASPRRRQRVLFLCTGNSARSQIAEAVLERMSSGSIQAVSAGSYPETTPSERHPRPPLVRDRHRRTSNEASRRVPCSAVRHSDHTVRSRS